uniref:Fgenesh protein 93 n=1 Tax=Beta vulgaris TaxID=161934 RepID=Q20CC7_BETVU|nr:Fgenesh protein 93 [Beta vulgaris]
MEECPYLGLFPSIFPKGFEELVVRFRNWKTNCKQLYKAVMSKPGQDRKPAYAEVVEELAEEDDPESSDQGYESGSKGDD